MTEVFATGISHPAVVERMATGAEAAGFDGMLVVDSQNLAGDPRTIALIDGVKRSL